MSHPLIELKNSSKDVSQACVTYLCVEQKGSRNAHLFLLEEILIKSVAIGPKLLNMSHLKNSSNAVSQFFFLNCLAFFSQFFLFDMARHIFLALMEAVEIHTNSYHQKTPQQQVCTIELSHNF